MYKHLFRTALWVVWIFGIAWFLNVGAEYSKVINITWFNDNTSWQLIQSFEQKREDLELYFVSNTWSITHYTIMDRNMWATEVYNQNYTKPNAWSLWYQYQWWNNYGFMPCVSYQNGCSSFPNNEKRYYGWYSKEIWSSYVPSQFASNRWSSYKTWMNDWWTGDNIWWWWWDTDWSNWDWTLIWKNNERKLLSWRQWPCPEKYYIPSIYDWLTLETMRWNYSLNEEWKERSDELLLPAAWARRADGNVSQGIWWYYWSSSPNPAPKLADCAKLHEFRNYALYQGGNLQRSLWLPVRCAKYTPNYLNFTLHLNWGTGTVITFTGVVWEWKIVSIQNPKRANSIFLWWFDSEINWNRIFRWSLVPTNLYALWKCKDWYEENEEKTECILKTYDIIYNLNWWVNSELNPWVYTIETPIVVFQDATKKWYIFEWWYLDPEFTLRKETVPEWSVGNLVLYAKWICDLWYVENVEKTGCERIKVEFDANWWEFENWNKYFSIFSDTWIVNQNFIKVAHSSNLTGNWDYKVWKSGENPGEYCAPVSWNNWLSGNIEIYWSSSGFVQIKWIDELRVSVKYWGSSYGDNCIGPIWIWTWEHIDFDPSNPNHSGSAIRYLSSFPEYGTFGIDEFIVQSDSISVAQAGWCPNYGRFIRVSWTWVVGFVEYLDDAFDNIPEPSREWHKFVWWYLSDDTEFNTWSVSTGEVTYVHAKWECAQWYVNKQWQCVKEETKPSWWSSGGWWGWGWWGGSSSSCKNLPANAVANNSSTPSSNTNYYYSTNISKVCTFQCKTGYTRNEEKETCDKASDSQTTSWTTVKEPEASTWNNTKVETWNNTEMQTWSKIDSQPAEQTSEQTHQNDNSNTQDSSTSSQNDGKTYTQEFQEAYEFAHEKWITTMSTIQKADMNGKLTRIAMAKMLSQYAINVLWKTPDATLNNKFNDVSDKRDRDYDDWVTLAYQLWIMWQNMPWNNFRPDDEVSRAEFATALSRMLYNTSDWQYKSTDKYYTNHMSKLVKEWIITKDDPKMKELRWYVMIMLMRSSK